MEEKETVSVSKGVFVFKNNFKHKKTKPKRESVINIDERNDHNPYFSNNFWYTSYINLWTRLEEKIENLNNEMFSSVLSNLLKFIETSYDIASNEIPTAALLTGINMPDHEAQFTSLTKQIKQTITPHVACLNSQDCQNIKNMVEQMISQFIFNDVEPVDEENNQENIMETSTESSEPIKIKKTNLNFALLESWYENLTNGSPSKKQKTHEENRNILVVIIPDFESFGAKSLQRFIQIISSHVKRLPFVFVFGIATSLTTLHTSLPYHVSSKIRINVFKSQPSTVYLNNVLESIFFTTTCPFQMGGKVFNLFTDLFLFYDLSVNNFIKNIKLAMAEHFYYGNAMAFCNSDKFYRDHVLQNFTHEDCENARQLLSFRKLVESVNYEERIKLLTDDDYFADVLWDCVEKVRKFIRRFHIFLKCLNLLVSDLPGTPLGKQIREVYSIAVSTNITKTAQFKECFQLLSFQSKDELTKKLSNIIEYMATLVNEACKGPNKFLEIIMQLNKYLKMIDKINNLNESTENVNLPETDISVTKMDNRKQLKETLLGMTKQNTKPMNKYELIRKELLDFLLKMFEEYLFDPTTLHFHEIFFFNDISIQNHIVGVHRTAIHTALNNPHFYLQCSCCEIPDTTSIRRSMPDICIAYKLHLECGKMINLYDWLQGFLSIVDPTEYEDDSKMIVDPKLQARFTQAVSELEYLGFIKSSKRKADHVSRLTWGG